MSTKSKIRSILKIYFSEVAKKEPKFEINDLAVFISVLVAIVAIKKAIKKNKCTDYSNFEKITYFKKELGLISERYPELILTFENVQAQIKPDIVSLILSQITDIYKNPGDDIDNVISWFYQYLKKDSEKAAFKKLDNYKSKLEGRDVLLTTQFFTDNYMVKYLVDKSISNQNHVQFSDIAIIDPAAGGGNFLNYSFQKLYDGFLKINESMSNKDIVDLILNESISGYDLDYNLSQIASLSVFAKACSYAIPSPSTRIKIYGGVTGDKLGFLNPDLTTNVINGLNFNSHLKNLQAKNKSLIFVTNPPFMGKRDMDVELKTKLLSLYPESKGDLCVSFLQKMIGIMRPTDSIGVVVQNNWMYLSSYKEFRALFLSTSKLNECIDLGSNSFEDINGEKTTVALCIINRDKADSSTFHDLKYLNIGQKKKTISEENYPENLTSKINQSIFLQSSNHEFNYKRTHTQNSIFSLPSYSEFANPMQGTSTGNNSKYVKYSWEVPNNPDWKSVSKGGGFSKWAGLNYFKVHWGKNAEILKSSQGSAIRNLNKIPSTQLVYSDTGTLGLNVRVLEKDQVFIASGPGIQVLAGEMYAHLAFLNSRVATFLIKQTNPKYTVSAGYISKLPVSAKILFSKKLSLKALTCHKLKENYLCSKLPNNEFIHYNYEDIKNVEDFLTEKIIEDLDNEFKRLSIEYEIEKFIIGEFESSGLDLLEMKRVVGESPLNYKVNTSHVEHKKLDLILSRAIDINCQSLSRRLNGFSIGSESALENISYKLGDNPKSIFANIKTSIFELIYTREKYYQDLLHKIILSELGVKKIDHFKRHGMKADKLFDILMSKYKFLSSYKFSKAALLYIVEVHHAASFQKKPLITLNNNNIMVGNING
jgi:hypothetical protein